jgi:hypothetical protein
MKDNDSIEAINGVGSNSVENLNMGESPDLNGRREKDGLMKQ